MKIKHSFLALSIAISSAAFAYEIPSTDELLAKANTALQTGDYSTAYNEAMHAASLGSEDAMRALSMMYGLGIGTSQDMERHYAWLMVAVWDKKDEMKIIYDRLYAKGEIPLYDKAYARAAELYRTISMNKKSVGGAK